MSPQISPQISPQLAPLPQLPRTRCRGLIDKVKPTRTDETPQITQLIHLVGFWDFVILSVDRRMGFEGYFNTQAL